MAGARAKVGDEEGQVGAIGCIVVEDALMGHTVLPWSRSACTHGGVNSACFGEPHSHSTLLV